MGYFSTLSWGGRWEQVSVLLDLFACLLLACLFAYKCISVQCVLLLTLVVACEGYSFCTFHTARVLVVVWEHGENILSSWHSCVLF
jgi:hypothetical protein